MKKVKNVLVFLLLMAVITAASFGFVGCDKKPEKNYRLKDLFNSQGHFSMYKPDEISELGDNYFQDTLVIDEYENTGILTSEKIDKFLFAEDGEHYEIPISSDDNKIGVDIKLFPSIQATEVTITEVSYTAYSTIDLRTIESVKDYGGTLRWQPKEEMALMEDNKYAKSQTTFPTREKQTEVYNGTTYWVREVTYENLSIAFSDASNMKANSYDRNNDPYDYTYLELSLPTRSYICDLKMKFTYNE